MLIQGSSTEPMVTISTGAVKWFQNNSGGSSGGSRGRYPGNGEKTGEVALLI